MTTDDATRDSYDRVADEYARRIYGELADKPLDRQWLDRFAAHLRGKGTACDLGCGPGHVARYLHERGVPVLGLDLSPGMIEQARRLNPGIEFRVGDFRALAAEDGAWAGIASFYSIIHVSREQIVAVLRELWRALAPGGRLLLAFHLFEERLHLQELLGCPVSLDYERLRSDEMREWLEAAGFRVEETLERDPYPDVEHPSRRAYIQAIKQAFKPEDR